MVRGRIFSLLLDEAAVYVVDIMGSHPVAAGFQAASGPVVAECLGAAIAADPGQPVLVVMGERIMDDVTIFPPNESFQNNNEHDPIF